eukprot:gene9372-biopygen6731
MLVELPHLMVIAALCCIESVGWQPCARLAGGLCGVLLITLALELCCTPYTAPAENALAALLVALQRVAQ